MSRLRTTNGLLLIVLLALLGVLLVYVPTKVLELYDRVKGLGPPYVHFYWGLVGTGAAILVLLLGGVVAKLWQATRDKRSRRERTARNPSQLSAADKERELADNLAAVADLSDKSNLPDDVQKHLQSLVDQVEEKQAAQTLEIVAFGTISSGKSSLLNALAGRDAFQTDPRGGTTRQRLEIPWPGSDRVLLVDTPGLRVWARSKALNRSRSPLRPPAKRT
jgi:hypothetical protein